MALEFAPEHDAVASLQGCNCGCESASPVADRIRSAVVKALLAGEAPTVRQVEAAVAASPGEVHRTIGRLRAEGGIEFAADRIVAAAGVTRRHTDHTFSHAGRTIHTWCALDAVGLPLALGLRSTARTRCPCCRAGLEFEVEGGRLVTGDEALWLPTSPALGRREFCAYASLFCRLDHLEQWWHTAGQPAGMPVATDALPAVARAVFPAEM